MKNVLVTGGGGFVGTTLVRQLLAKDCTVVVAGRHDYSHVNELGARCLVGNITDKEFTDKICSDVDTVFHTAAKAGIWGDWQEYKSTNIDGTHNIVASCKKNKVPRLIYTSTPSVVFDRKNIEAGDESLSYTDRFLCNYSKSKVAAEKHILSSNDSNLRTCAIRPHLIWGPGDPHLIPRLIERGKEGVLKIVGSGSNLVDITYVDNVAHAHILAAESLCRSGISAGQAYFIGQEQPVSLWLWINQLFKELGIPQLTKKVPFGIAYLAGGVLEMYHRILGKSKEPVMTRFLALQLSRSHYFSHEKAKRDLGYQPIISLEEGKERLLASMKQ